ncbi:LysR family transcriptional regulator [Nonomuraea roseoviolacea]|uniref:DNA-binding transcriptional LysR family regulator n=1 Tax=Nonomuraea roseoviolacea subsp. carminata TaxID=160689 RepID=A0ABT1K023_9ACTN|nr:LysR family transcriptional regulator [Nonomuraea roseoviolacea]MCP2347348.1 DNA-binding transcriptional LysR family regulator [Nonomuraea roseoviolacea subsp. carminata]
MELRDIEIFLTLAQELHFGRTAERLHITTSRVSQAIKKQERRIGAPLFDRTSRTVRLTPVGEQLYHRLSAGYLQIMDGIEEVKGTVNGVTGTLNVGTIGPHSLLMKDAFDLFHARHPGARLQHREVQPPSPLDLLRSGEVDVAHLWLPVREPDLTIGPLTHTSQVLLMVSASHPYARRDSVCLEDFGDCAVVQGKSIPAYMEEVFNPYRTPSGRLVARGPAVSTWQEALNVVASGQAVAGVTAEITEFYPWPSLVYLPIDDAEPVQWAYVWRSGHESPLIRAFAQAVTDSRQAGTHMSGS